MFNFFSEIKKELKLQDFEGGYNIVNLNGKAIYIEGQKGLISLSDAQIMVKVKEKIISVIGNDLKLKEITKETISIIGEITKTEVI